MFTEIPERLVRTLKLRSDGTPEPLTIPITELENTIVVLESEKPVMIADVNVDTTALETVIPGYAKTYRFRMVNAAAVTTRLHGLPEGVLQAFRASIDLELRYDEAKDLYVTRER